MTVTIGRWELLAALGGAVAAWPLAAPRAAAGDAGGRFLRDATAAGSEYAAIRIPLSNKSCSRRACNR